MFEYSVWLLTHVIRFIACDKAQVLLELNENKTTMEKEHANYAEMSKTYKTK